MLEKAMMGCALSVAIVAVGCSRSVREDADIRAPHAEILKPLTALEQDAGLPAALRQGITFLAAYDDFESQDAVLMWMLHRAQEDADIEIVEPFLLQLLALDPRYAERVISVLGSSMIHTAPDAWMQLLQAAVMPPRIRVYGHSVWFHAHGAEAPVEAVHDKLLALLDPELQGYAEGVFRDVMVQSLRHADAHRIWALLEMLQQSLAPMSHMKANFLYSWGEALLRDGRVADALAHYQEHAQRLGDPRLSQSVSKLLQQAAEQDDAAVITAALAWGYAAEAFPMLRNRVARWALVQLRSEADVKQMTAGVQHVLAQGISVDLVSAHFLADLFYPALTGAERQELLGLLDVLQQMEAAAVASTESVRASIATAILDVHFYLEDFRGALDRITQGIPGYDEAWHTEVHDKVQAHLAEAEGRTADAVGFYAAHIERVRKWEEPLRSPADNRLVMSHEVMALNERRIGDIWQAAGAADKALAAYKRALAHYHSAVEQYADDAVSQSMMRAALTELENILR